MCASFCSHVSYFIPVWVHFSYSFCSPVGFYAYASYLPRRQWFKWGPSALALSDFHCVVWPHYIPFAFCMCVPFGETSWYPSSEVFVFEVSFRRGSWSFLGWLSCFSTLYFNWPSLLVPFHLSWYLLTTARSYFGFRSHLKGYVTWFGLYSGCWFLGVLSTNPQGFLCLCGSRFEATYYLTLNSILHIARTTRRFHLLRIKSSPGFVAGKRFGWRRPWGRAWWIIFFDYWCTFWERSRLILQNL